MRVDHDVAAATRASRKLLRLLVLARLSSLGSHAFSTTREPLASLGAVEISHQAQSRIVRHEQVPRGEGAFVESGNVGDDIEIMPAEIGGGGVDDPLTNTFIVQSEVGATTTAIYATGYAPTVDADPNAIDVRSTAAPPVTAAPAPPPPTEAPPADPLLNNAVTEAPPADPLLNNAPPAPPPPAPPPLMGSAPPAPPPVAAPLSIHTQSGFEVRGDAGQEGPAGDPGDKGGRGSDGLEGEIGMRGPTGPHGEKGESGPSGSSQHASAVPAGWMMYALWFNIVIAAVVFIYSYLEFICNKKPTTYLFGGEFCTSKCGRTGDSFNGCCWRISCGCCCRPSIKTMDTGHGEEAYAGGEGQGEGEGGYEY